MKKIKLSLFSLLLLLNISIYAQEITEIPDEMFEQYLIDKNIDTDGELNGQVWTADIENLTELEINGSNTMLYYGDYIEDLTGIEDFISLESLTIYGTYITELSIQNLSNLTFLFCSDNMLESIDLSGNPLLEILYAANGGDVYPFNSIEIIDLSQNPNIKEVYAHPLSGINLKNGNNNPNMKLILTSNMEDEYTDILCIEVDDPEAATNQEYPYSEWDLGNSASYWWEHINFTDNLNVCNLGVEKKDENKISIYPNPTKDYVYFDKVISPFEVTFYTLSGQQVLSQRIDSSNNMINISSFFEGVYFYRILFDKQTLQYGKIIKK